MNLSNEKIQDLKIGIVGLGLIGGSLAKALKTKAKITIWYGIDRNESTIKSALFDGVILNGGENLNSLVECDIVFICTPISSIPGILNELQTFYKGIVTDCASTKYAIAFHVLNHCPEMRYIGGHPMAGSERAGYGASNENLFENAPYIICNENKRLKEDENILENIIHSIDSRVVRMPTDEHDKVVGLVSHLPHVVAYALVDAVKSDGDERIQTIAAGGFRDITRIASSDPVLWADILCDSKLTVLSLLDQYDKSIKKIKKLLEKDEKETLIQYFTKAKEFRDAMPLHSKMKSNTVQLWVEIDDRPGMIAIVSAIFADAMINIRNIGIQDTREYEGGALRITLSTYEDALSGYELLKKEKMQVRIVR